MEVMAETHIVQIHCGIPADESYGDTKDNSTFHILGPNNSTCSNLENEPSKIYKNKVLLHYCQC